MTIEHNYRSPEHAHRAGRRHAEARKQPASGLIAFPGHYDEGYLSVPLKLPLPGDQFDGRTVIASTWTDDLSDTRLATLLLLNHAPPYYTVAEIVAKPGKAWQLGEHDEFPNINPAVTDGYAQWGGDY